MKRLKPEKKRLIVSIIAVVLILAMVISVVAPFLSPVFADEINKSDITVEANVGFDGNIKIGNNGKNKLTEFNIKIKNNSDKDFKGSLNIPIKKINGKYEIVKAGLELNPKENKEICFTNEINTIISNIDIVIKDEKNNTVKEEKIPVKASSSDNIWVGFLSNSPEKLTYLKASFMQSNELFINLDKNNFPKNDRTLDSLNVIFSDDFDFSALTQEQKNYIKSWIEKGGVLVTSSDFKAELDSYEDKTINDNALENIYNYSGALSENDANLLNNVEAYNYGLGKIYFNNFSIGNAELINSVVFGGESLEVANYLNEGGGENVNNNSIVKSLAYFNDRMPIEDSITIFIIFVVIFIYLVFVAFLLYFILKKKDMLKKALWILPCSALCLTLLIFISSFSTIYKRPQANVITIFEQGEGYDKLRKVVSAIGISSADKGEVKVEIPNKFSSYEYSDDSGYGLEDTDNTDQSFDKLEKEVEKGVGEDSYIKTFNNGKWSKIKFNTFYNSSEENGKIDAEINAVDDVLKGTITNNTGYDLYDVVVSCEGNSFVIDKIAKGESVEIGEGEYICKITSNSFSYDNNVLTDGNRSSKNQKDNRLYELELRQDIVNSITNSSDSNSDKITFNIIGFNSEDAIKDSIMVNNKEAVLRNTNVFVVEKNIDFGSFLSGEIPEGVIEPTVENDNGMVDKESDSLQIYDEAMPAMVSFKIPEGIAINGYSFVLDSLNSETKIFNYNTKKWEEVKESYSSNAYDYIDDNNKIELQIKAEGNMITMPKIKIKLMLTETEGNNNAWN